jgi:hypothetical protein
MECLERYAKNQADKHPDAVLSTGTRWLRHYDQTGMTHNGLEKVLTHDDLGVDCGPK